MGRPALDSEKPGNITVRALEPKSKGYQARCRYRDLDGLTRSVSAQGRTKTAAQNALLAKVKTRVRGGVGELKSTSRFAEAASLWLAQVQQTAAGTTYHSYRQWLTGRVIHDIGNMQLWELRTGYLDAYFTRLRVDRAYKPETLRQIRSVVRGPLELAIKHEAILHNPIDHITKITGRRDAPRALSGQERHRFLAWLDASSDDPLEREAQETARRRDLPDIVRVMFGTGLRIGELMALRWCDIDLDGVPLIVNGQPMLVPVLRVERNVARVVGEGLVLHDGKTASAKRTVPLPRFVVATLTVRRARMPELADDAPVFCAMTTAGPGWRDPGKVTSWVRDVRRWVGLEWMTTHSWRKTAATILDEAGLSAVMIANQLGHSQVSITQNIYLGRGVTNPAAANALDAALAND